MGLLKPAVNQQSYLKAGILGFQGSGKSYTAAMLAMAIAKIIEASKQPVKPVAFFDTEAGSDFLIPKFEKAGVPLMSVKSRAFADLVTVGKEAEQSCSVLIADSVTAVWNELCESYLKKINDARKKKGYNRIYKLEFQHWAEVKRTWQAWTSFFLNSNLHIIVCGRAGFEYDFIENEDSGKKELQKTGTKMKAEGEFGYEPSLLLEMERASQGGKAGAGWIHRAHVLKDRTDLINGKMFDFGKRSKKANQKDEYTDVFTAFEPVIRALNLGGEQVSVDVTRTSEGLFTDEGQSPMSHRASQVNIALEEIEGTLVVLWPGQDAVSKRRKALVIETLFETRSWTKVATMRLERLEDALRTLRRFEFALKSEPKNGETDEAILATLKIAQAEACAVHDAPVAAESEPATTDDIEEPVI